MKLTGTIIHKAKEYGPGCDVPDGADVERLKRLGLVDDKPAARPQRPKPVEHAHGDNKHKHPLAFDDLPTTALAGIVKSHSGLDVDTSSSRPEEKVRADLLDALGSAHPPE
jgi:hypothetical protein